MTRGRTIFCRLYEDAIGEGLARTGKCDSELLEHDGEPYLGGDSSISCHPFDLISGSIGLGFGFGRFGSARTVGTVPTSSSVVTGSTYTLHSEHSRLHKDQQGRLLFLLRLIIIQGHLFCSKNCLLKKADATLHGSATTIFLCDSIPQVP